MIIILPQRKSWDNGRKCRLSGYQKLHLGELVSKAHRHNVYPQEQQSFVKHFLFICALLLCLGFTHTSFAQVSKPHYLLKKIDSKVELSTYKKALDEFGKLDEFRFINSRRTIYFRDQRVAVELFSAQELQDKYQKRISPFTIKDTTKAVNVSFMLTSDDRIYVHVNKP